MENERKKEKEKKNIAKKMEKKVMPCVYIELEKEFKIK